MHKTFGESGFKLPKNGRRLLIHGSTGLALGIILGLALFSIVGLPQLPEPWSGVSSQYALSKFSSVEELKEFLNKSGSPMDWYYYESSAKGIRLTVPAPAPTFGTAVESLASESYEFSQTNIQVEGVDEADIIKTDGEYIYLVSGQRLIIVRAYPPESAEVLSEISFNGTIRGLFINGDRLMVFREDYGLPDYPSERKTSEVIIIPIWQIETRLLIYNLEDRERPVLAREISVNGSYFTSRMIGNNVYLLVTQPAGVLEGEVYLPTIRYDDEPPEKVEALKIYYSNVSDNYYAFTTVIAADIMNVEAPKYEVFLVGATSAVYVSMDNIYVAIPKMPVFNEEEPVSEMTEIHRIHIADGDIEYEASGAVPGRVLNQFSMDEHSGHFRIATTTGNLWWTPGEATSKNHVYVLNMNLNITGKIEDIAPGETIYSARFMGERCYLVTFKKIDPFFVIDLKDPADPQILGKLKITGYSDYLHPYDENLIIGIGKETVEAEEGDFAWYQGVKISLFDVSDVQNPIEIDKYEIGDRGTDSPILRDHKALLFDKEKNLLAIPVLVAEINEEQYPNGVPDNAYGDYVWQGAYVFNIDENGFTLRGTITHIENLSEFQKSGYYFFSDYQVERALYIDNVLYTLSNKKIKMNNLTDLGEISEIELP